MASGMGMNGLIVFRIIYPALRWFGWSVVVLYAAMALAVLGTRYVLFPKATHYKPIIEAQLSELLGNRVELGHVSADWHRFNPRIELDQITLHDSQGTRVLKIPHLSAVVSWRSLFTWSPQFVSVHAGGIDLSVRRDNQRRLWVLGRSVADTSSGSPDNPGDDTATPSDRAMRWLLAQPQIRLYDATIRWVDETRDAAPLVLQDVSLKIRNGARQHQFSLAARPARDIGGNFDMRGNVTRSPDPARPFGLESARGQLYVHIDEMRPEAWISWIDWPGSLRSDQVSVRAWLDVGQGDLLDVTADVRLRNARWQGDDMQTVQSRFARLYVDGPWQALRDITPHDVSAAEHTLPASFPNGPPADTLIFGLQAHDVQVSLPKLYDEPVVLGALGAQGAAQRGAEGIALQLDDIAVHSPDIDFRGAGRWVFGPGPASAYVDASARVSRANLAAVHRYMPRFINDDVRHWLEHGLLQGQVHDARVVLRGDLSNFPFDDADSEGEFAIDGSFRDAVIDYAPKDEHDAGWPRLDAVQGHIQLDRASLSIQADTARIEPAEGAQIQLEGIDAHIADLQDDAVLEVSGITHGDGSAYMAFLHGSALSGLLGNVFDQTRAHGGWRLPLALTIPLARVTDTRVEGAIHID